MPKFLEVLNIFDCKLTCVLLNNAEVAEAEPHTGVLKVLQHLYVLILAPLVQKLLHMLHEEHSGFTFHGENQFIRKLW